MIPFSLQVPHAAGAIPFVVDEDVSLTKPYPPTGARIDIMCVRIGGRLHFHPRRLAELQAALRSTQPTTAELGRWADDGGIKCRVI